MLDSDIIIDRVASLTQLDHNQVRAAIALLDEGNTVPFITRYRKERTGGLDEEQLRQVESAVAATRQLTERAEAILKSIEQQGKLTDELRRQIQLADTLKRLEDLYQPFRPRRRSRADAARERGLEPLAQRILQHQWSDSQLAAETNRLATSLSDVDGPALLQGVIDILAEHISDRPEARDIVRQAVWATGAIDARLIPDAEHAATFQDYAEYEERLNRIPPHRILALNRGESEKCLRIRVRWDETRAVEKLGRLLRVPNSPARETWGTAIEEAIDRLIGPAMEREVRRDLTEKADTHAVEVFTRNLRQLLLQPPLKSTRVLAIDPGFRTGCKLAALSETGELLTHDVIYLTGNDEKVASQRGRLAQLVRQHHCSVIAIGNGTGSRETEQLVAETIQEHQLSVRYILVNEAGASIYSASDVARDEFPELDATVRGTISIGRRLQDPLSELVKIDPQHVGVGMYQHDVSEKLLKRSLVTVVESCVNFVGVELNHASRELLQYVSGLTPNLALKIVTYRDQHGPFRTRTELLKVPGIGQSTFTQAAGFLKLEGQDPLDATWVHPESYSLAKTLLAKLEIDQQQLRSGQLDPVCRERLESIEPNRVASDFQSDPFTLRQVLEALSRPGRDPREELPGPLFRSEILKLEDLSIGMELTGVVRNVVDFGAFVDIGLKDSGLVHISQMSTNYVANPSELVSVGDVVTTWVLSIDHDRRRIALTLIPPA